MDAWDPLLRAAERIVAIEATELRPALSQAADIATEACGAEKVDVFIHDPAIATLVAMGVSTTPLAQRQLSLGLDRLPIANGGRVVQVFRTGEAYDTGRADADELELPGIRGPLGIRSHIIVPFAIEGAPRGVLSVSSTVPEAFGVEHLRLVRVLAQWVGLVAHRAEITERLAESAQREGRRSAAEELVTVVAHDLRNYVGPVHGRLHLLRQRAQREHRDTDLRDADAALRSLERLVHVLTDLLDVGRIDQGLFEVERRPLDLVALLGEASAAMQLPDRTIAVEAPPELVMDGDATKLRQAFDNVLSNSAKYSPSGGTVRVDVRLEPDRRAAVIAVSDDGPGMDPALAARIFTRFGRGPGSQGIGLGLYLAREIAIAHGGSLEVDTSPGHGATFTMRLPAHAA
jgi:two-component system, OmpR family, sensor kinase